MLRFRREKLKKASKPAEALDKKAIKPIRPYRDPRSIFSNYLFLCTILFFAGILFNPIAFVQSATATLNQHDWIFQTGNIATQPFGNWSHYSNRNIGVVDGSDIHLEETDYVLTQRSDDGVTDICVATGCSTGDGFNGPTGTLTNAVVSGTGSTAYVHLARTPRFTDWSKRFLGNYATAGSSADVAVAGNLPVYAYVADGDSGLHVFDVTNPANIQFKNTYVTAGNANGVVVSGDYAYVAYGTSGLKIVDVTDPTELTLKGTFGTAGTAYGIAVAGHYAYIAEGSDDLQIVNVNLPGSPYEHATYGALDAQNVVIVGNIMYIADGTNGLHIVNIDSQASPDPSFSGQINTTFAYDVAVSGSYAYVADGSSGVRIINIADPSDPSLAGTAAVPGDARSITIDIVNSIAYVYVADNASGLHIFKMSSPTTLKRVGSYETNDAMAVAVANNKAYLADGTDGLQIIDITTPIPAPDLRNTVSTPGSANDIVIEGRYAYVVDVSNSLTIFDLNTPAHPTYIGTLPSLGVALDIDVEGEYAYVAGGADGLKVINISDVTSPLSVMTYATTMARGVAVVGNTVYVADGTSGLQIMDISDPADPLFIGKYDTDIDAYNVVVVGSTAYVADDISGLQIININNPANPELIFAYTTTGSARALTVVGNIAYVADKDSGLQIIDVSDPALPSLVSTYNSTGDVLDVTVVEDYAYITDSSSVINSSLKIINISTPAAPVLAAVYDTQGKAKGVKISGNFAYVVDDTDGLSTLKVTDYLSAGVFESAVMDLGGVQNFMSFEWSPLNLVPSVTLTMQARAGTVVAPDCPGACTFWTNWNAVTNGVDTGATFDNNRYVQYKASLTTTDAIISPKLKKLKLHFSNYPVGAGLESSVFDTGQQDNFLKNISWIETGATSPFDVRLQVATSANNISWNYCGTNACQTNGWLDWDDSVNNYYTISGDFTNLLSRDAVNDRFFKYKVWLSGDGTGTSAIDDISITFDTAHLDLTSTTSTPTADAVFDIIVTVQDSGGTTITTHDNLVTIELTASEPQPDRSPCISSFTADGNTTFIAAGTYGAGGDPSGVLTISNVKLCDATTPSFTISAQETSGGALNSTTALTIDEVKVDTGSLVLAFSASLGAEYLSTVDFNPSLKVNIQDPFGNIDTTDTTSISLSAFNDSVCSSTPVTGTFNWGDGSAVPAAAGVATFSNVNYDKPENIYVKASGGSFSNICSSKITIVDEGFVVQVDALYDAANDAIMVASSLLRNGSLVSDNTMTLSSLIISWNDGNTSSGNLSANETPDDETNSVFHTTWNPGALTVNIAYTVQSDIIYQTTTYSGLTTFHINELGEISSSLKALDTKLDTVKSTVSGIGIKAVQVKANVLSLDTKLTAHQASQAAYRAQTTTKLALIVTKIGAVLEDTSTTLPKVLKDTISAELAKGSQTEIVTTQSAVKTGATIPFRYRTATGLSPKLTVFDPSDVEKITSASMNEVSGTGIYVYNLTFNTAWGLGDFMIRVDELTKPTIDHIILNVVKATTDSSGSTGGAIGSSAVTLDTLYSRMNNVNANMDTLLSNIDIVKGNTENVSTDIAEVIKEMDNFTSTGTGPKGDVSKLGPYLNSVSAIIGVSGNTNDYRTILGKLNNIEDILNDIGVDANTARDFNLSAREKAERIRMFVAKVMTELRENGTVADPEEKVEILEDYLTELKETVEAIPSSVTTESIAESVEYTLNELAQITTDNKGLKEIVPLAKQDLGVTEVKDVESLTTSDMLEMRNDVSGLKSLMVEIRGLLDEEVNQPVVHGWLEGN